MCWEELPDILLEEVYCHLTYKQRYYASMVCKHWHDLFYSPRIWENFVFKELTLTRKRFNMFRGYQYELSHHKAQMCLARVGHYFRQITIEPVQDYYNLYGFLTVLAAFLEFFEEYPMPLLESFHFEFCCETRGLSGQIVHGTGGKILDELKRLLNNLRSLESLTLNQLLLDTKEAPGLLESVLNNNAETLKSLEIMNCTKGTYPLFYVGLFPCLNKLTISPQHLSVDVVAMLASSSLTLLCIVQDMYTEATTLIPGETWREIKHMAPQLHVHLEARGHTRQEILFQPRAPVTAIIYSTPYAKVCAHAIITIIEHYRLTLEVYAQVGLPKLHGARGFNERADTLLVMLVRQCRKLRVLAIRERISTATVLVIAAAAPHLQELHVRRNALIKRFDWPKTLEWSDDYYDSLKINARNYDLMEKEVSRLLGFPWKALSDKEYKRLKF